MSDYEVSAATIAEYLAPLFLFLMALVAWGVREFAKRDTFTWDTYISCAGAYFFGFGILVLVPLDLSLAITGRREENLEGYEDNIDEVEDLYQVFFGFCFVLYTVAIVFQQYYLDSGYFTIKDRMFDALYMWLRFSGAMGVFGLIIFITVIAGGYVDSGDAIAVLAAVVISVTNTVGLIAIVVLLGYAVVEFPKSVFMSTLYHEQLHKVEMAFATESKVIQDARLDTTQTVSDVFATMEEVRRTCHPGLIAEAQLVVAECPEGYRGSKIGRVMRDRNGEVTTAQLAALRQRVKWNKGFLLASTRRWEALAMEAYRLQDIIKSEKNDVIHWSPLFFDGQPGTPEQKRWITSWRPRLVQVGAIAAAVMSIFVVLGQIGMMVGFGNELSVWSSAIHDDDASGGGIVCFAMFTLAYCSYLVFWAVSQVRLTFMGISMMEILAEQQTTAYSMLMHAYVCCRLCPPLAFYYTSLVFESGIFDGDFLEDEVVERDRPTAFAKFYGQRLEVVPFFGDHFAVFFPAVILGIAALQSVNFLNRFLILIRLPQLQFGETVPDEGLLQEGKKQLARHRAAKERTVQRSAQRGGFRTLQKTGWLSNISSAFGGQKSLASQDDIDEGAQIMKPDVENKVPTRTEPQPLEGESEYKTTSVLGVGTRWETCYLKVASGHLSWWKSKTAAGGIPDNVVEMASVAGLDVHRKARDGTKDVKRIDILVGDKDYEFRFATEEEASNWLDALQSWAEWSSSGVVSPFGGAYPTEQAVLETDEAKNISKEEADILDSIRIEGFDEVGGTGDQPSHIEGYLKKKSNSKLMASWQDRWFSIDSRSRALKYSETSTSLNSELGSIPLQNAVIEQYYKEGQENDPRRFNVITAGQEKHKLMAKTPEEAQYWISILNEWSKFAS